LARFQPVLRPPYPTPTRGMVPPDTPHRLARSADAHFGSHAVPLAAVPLSVNSVTHLAPARLPRRPACVASARSCSASRTAHWTGNPSEPHAKRVQARCRGAVTENSRKNSRRSVGPAMECTGSCTPCPVFATPPDDQRCDVCCRDHESLDVSTCSSVLSYAMDSSSRRDDAALRETRSHTTRPRCECTETCAGLSDQRR